MIYKLRIKLAFLMLRLARGIHPDLAKLRADILESQERLKVFGEL